MTFLASKNIFAYPSKEKAVQEAKIYFHQVREEDSIISTRKEPEVLKSRENPNEKQ